MQNPGHAKTLYGLGFKIAFGAYFGYATGQILHRELQMVTARVVKKLS